MKSVQVVAQRVLPIIPFSPANTGQVKKEVSKMNASDIVCFFPENGVLSLQAKKSSNMDFLGASLPVPAKIGSNYNTLVITPDQKEVDVIAIICHENEILNGKLSGKNNYGFLISIEHVMLSSKTVSEFTPLPNHIGSLDTEGLLSVMIGDKIYWWKEYAELSGGDLSGFVSDPNLLCRFMAGKATPDEVNTASIGFAEERQARKEIPAIKEEIGKLKAENDRLIELVETELVSKTVHEKAVEQVKYLLDARLEDAKLIDGLNVKLRALENDKIYLNDQIKKYLRTLQLMNHHLQGRVRRWITPVPVLKILSEHVDEQKFFSESEQRLKS